MIARLLPVLVLCAALVLAVAGSASATGPGGWDHLGTGATSAGGALDGRVDALHVAAPDALYAGGVFTSAGGAPASSVARWDGSAWHPTGAPALNGGVSAIAYDNGKLYVGGNFTNAGGNGAADFLAVWDGASWKPFCAPITANVAALQVIGRTLYVGGSFADGANLATADKLVACNLDTGTPSSTVDASEDINGAIYALTADAAGRLYAAGTFINMDQILHADHVAMYDGTWHAMGAGAVDDITRSITSDGTNVYIGTDSVNVAGIAQADHVARWNGAAWSALGANAAGTDGWLPATSFVNGLAASGSEVYATGSFQNADGQPTADMVARFDGTRWAPMGSDGAGNGPLPGPGNAIALFGGQAVVGGNFVTAGGDPRAAYIARYPGAVHGLKAVIDLVGYGGVYLDTTTTVTGAPSDGDLPITGYRWSFSDGSPDATGVTITHRWTQPGPNTITLTVTDSGGHTAQDQFFESITGTPPTVRFTSSAPSAFVGQALSFDARATTSVYGPIVSYDWEWGDRTANGSGATPTHVYTTPGTYSVLVWARDTFAQTGINYTTIAIRALVAPAVSHAAVSNARFRVAPRATAVTAAARAPLGTTFRFTLKAPAKVTVAITRRCSARHCHAAKAGTLVRSKLQNGPNAIAFSGRIGKRALRPGRYTATLTARNAKGAAKPVALRFTVVT